MVWIEDFFIPALLMIITTISGYIVHILKESRKVNNANAKGTMLLLRRQIIFDHDRFCTKKEPMRHFDLDDITEIHDAYKDLGGNGLTDKMYEDLRKIEIGDGR